MTKISVHAVISKISDRLMDADTTSFLLPVAFGMMTTHSTIITNNHGHQQ